MMIAHISFYKEVEQDNYEKGCHGTRTIVFDERFTIDFTDTKNLKEKLADYLYGFMDVTKENFLKFTENECENNRFDYAQTENKDGEHITLTIDNPDGYCAMYFFYVDKVTTEIINYKF